MSDNDSFQKVCEIRAAFFRLNDLLGEFVPEDRQTDSASNDVYTVLGAFDWLQESQKQLEQAAREQEGVAPMRVLINSLIESARCLGASDTKDSEDYWSEKVALYRDQIYTHPSQSQGVPEVLALCHKCNQEFSVPLEGGGNATTDLLCNFCDCPHCDTRNDLWIKISTPAAPQADEWVKCAEQPPAEVFSEMDTLIDLLRDTAMDEGKVDTCYDQPNKNPRLATALNWLADLVATGLIRPQPHEQGDE